MIDKNLLDAWFPAEPVTGDPTESQQKRLATIEKFKDFMLEFVRRTRDALAKRGMTDQELRENERHFTAILRSHAELFDHITPSKTVAEDVCRELRIARAAWLNWLYGLSNHAPVEKEAAFRLATDAICKACWLAETCVREEKNYRPPWPAHRKETPNDQRE